MICTRWQHGSTWPKIIPRAQTETAKSAAGVCFAIHRAMGQGMLNTATRPGTKPCQWAK